MHKLLLASLPLLASATLVFNPNNYWTDPAGFEALPCFTITADLTSWTLKLLFDQPVDSIEVWAADILRTNADKTKYVLTNKPHNGVQHVGNELCIDFIAHGNVTRDIQITAFIKELADGGTYETSATMLLKVLVAVLPFLVSGIVIHPKNVWDEVGDDTRGFDANPCLDITLPMDGWTLYLAFSQPMDSVTILDADLACTNGEKTIYVFTNKPYNRVLWNNCFPFNGYGNVTDDFSITVFIDESPGGGTPKACASSAFIG